eukprot:gene102-186_t
MASSSGSSAGPASATREVADVRFDVFCRFLENVVRAKKKKEKLDTLWGFLRPVADGDMWPAFRLLFPQVDRHRGNYEMKEAKLAAVMAQVLGLPTKEKKRLLGYRDASLQDGFRCIPGDFSSVFFSCIEQRAVYQSKGLKLSVVNEMLDQLSVEYEPRAAAADAGSTSDAAAHAGKSTSAGPAAGQNGQSGTSGAASATGGTGATGAKNGIDFLDVEKKQEKLTVKVLTSCVRQMSPVELKWLARMILKDCKLGFSHEACLRGFAEN